ncbi:sigma factor, partial [Bacillus sp. GbtcB13]|uniref:sigma factor n=1 Tax=Bacillus sp. GbtcB13 TaxID=2824758 RepID=UPI00267215D1
MLSMTKDTHLAEVLLQEAFMRAYIHIHSYDHSIVKPWLFQVARNACIVYVRKHNKEVSPSDDMIGNLVQIAGPSPA